MLTRVLFVCAANATRRQMADALLRSLGGSDFEVQGAGVRPRDRVHPLTTRVLSAIRLGVSTHMTKSLDRFKAEAFDDVISLCDEARAPMTASVENIHWNTSDPLQRGDSNEQVSRETLWQVRRRIELFVTVAGVQARERHPRR